MAYVIDTDIWIHFNRYYPSDVPLFATLWERIKESVEDGIMVSPVEVREELERGHDGLAGVLEAFGPLFLPLTEEVQKAATSIEDVCPLADPNSDRNMADTFVVAMALATEGVVVAKENKRKSENHRHKIPDACDEFGVRCIDAYEFLKEMGWS